MWGIANKFNTTVNKLVQLNNIKNPNLIYAGEVIKVVGDTRLTYTIKRGDTLWGIARRYNTTIARIVQINRIKNPNLIYPGNTIQL